MEERILACQDCRSFSRNVQDICAAWIKYLHAVLLHASAGFEVGADALAGAFLEFWELSAAGLNDGLDLLLGLLGDGNHPIQVLIHKQTHKHLQENTQQLEHEVKWRFFSTSREYLFA